MSINWWWAVAIIAPLGAPALLRVTIIAIEQIQEWRRPKLGMASQDEVERLEATLREMMPKIVDLDFDDCLITDESSLYDFDPDVPLAESLKRLEDLYAVHEAELNGDFRLVKVCGLIAQRNEAP